jgi:signal transduction histidine kinase
MKSFHRACAGIVFLLAVAFAGVNFYLSSLYGSDSGRIYRVEINRLQKEIEQKGVESIRLDQYSCIENVAVLKEGAEASSFFEGSGSDYVIRMINGTYYRIEYKVQLTKEYRAISRSVNIVLALIAAAVLGILFYIWVKLVKPFHQLKDVPYELSKGNLTVGLKESKSRFFGRFVWGLDLLREKLEEQKAKELSLQKEKKLLVLSVSHDIKTPLSSIKLYSKALLKNLYDTEEKRAEIAKNIGTAADEIESFVAEIIKASSEDFLNLEVRKGEFYLHELIQKITSYYSEKLSLLKIDFHIEKYDNCLINGDLDRAVEVLQNIMENAIKYGDGKYIAVRISEEENCRLITVANSGCTLPEIELPNIFNSFWRGSNAGGSKGSGLGLYICRQLQKKMDGDIFAECENSEMRVTAVFRLV